MEYFLLIIFRYKKYLWKKNILLNIYELLINSSNSSKLILNLKLMNYIILYQININQIKII